MIYLAQAFSWLLILYYSAINCIYFLLLLISLRAIRRHHRLLRTLWHGQLRRSPLTPPISILVPARNEEKTIVASVQSLLALDYPEFEVIVVNDGSTDRTLRELSQAFDLLETDILHVSEIPSQPLRGVYMSHSERRLLVLDKQSCGRKADALNAGLNAASCPFVCAIDADAILERDALLRIMAPALRDPRRVVASGGIVRAVNGAVVEAGAVRDVRLPCRMLERFQVLEYLRSFLIGRQGFAALDMLLIISGAFGVFRRDLCRQIGGYRTSAIGEDMDLIVRLHRYLREQRQEYRIAFVPDPVCWTQVPSRLAGLARQRARWQNGLADVLWSNRRMFLNPRYGRIGLAAMPYQWIFELLAPAAEVVGWISVAAAICWGGVGQTFLLLYLVFGYLLGVLVSAGAVLIEEMVYHRYDRWRDLVRLLAICCLEPIGYRPLNTVWRLWGLWQFLRGEKDWHLQERSRFEADPASLQWRPGLANRR